MIKAIMINIRLTVEEYKKLLKKQQELGCITITDTVIQLLNTVIQPIITKKEEKKLFIDDFGNETEVPILWYSPFPIYDKPDIKVNL